MGITRNRLTATQIKSDSLQPGRHADGDGLYLSVSKSGARSWLFMWTRQGKRTEMGLGSAVRGTAPVSLAEARRKADEIRGILATGGDPLTDFSERAEKRNAVTFGELATAYVDEMAPNWSNPKHIAQWRMTLSKYAAPISRKPIDAIGLQDVLRVLRPIWQEKPETASRLRGRIEKVLDHATVKGLRTGDNPARWKGHLDAVLPSAKRRIVKHHRAMAYTDVPAFWQRLEEIEGSGAQAIRFTILTAARSGEVLGAQWSEIDLDARIWTIAAERMKARREHRIPLSDAALEVLQQAAAVRMGDFIFTGRDPAKPASNMMMTAVLRRLEVDATVHGFRSSFRDFAGEETSFPREVAEQALAHVVGDETERAYRRGDALEKRRQLMVTWASFVTENRKTVVALHGR